MLKSKKKKKLVKYVSIAYFCLYVNKLVHFKTFFGHFYHPSFPLGLKSNDTEPGYTVFTCPSVRSYTRAMLEIKTQREA